jgi:hypothetical protein
VSATATLVYHATAQGPVTPTALEAAMTGIVLDKAPIEQMTGCTLISDVTTLGGATANRTIVFAINTAAFVAKFPAGSDVASPFVDLYTHQLAAGLKCKVLADPVVIA